jgi:hypothetical protein
MAVAIPSAAESETIGEHQPDFFCLPSQVNPLVVQSPDKLPVAEV